MYLNEKRSVYEIFIKINWQSTTEMILRISVTSGT
jgi:hypothetical protein